MTINTKQTALEALKSEFEATNLSSYCEDIETALKYYDGDKEAADFISWYLEQYVYNAEIIGWYKATEYLKEKDPSLRESLTLAAELGYDLDSLSEGGSEFLATILLQEELTYEVDQLHGVLEDYFEALIEAEKDESEVA